MTNTSRLAVDSFEHLLPVSGDPVKSEIRGKLIYILNSKGEILPPADSPLGILWGLVNSTSSSVEQCEEVIRLDVALTSSILRVANSAAYGARSDNLSTAIMRIGFKSVREQVFNSGVFDRFSDWKLPPEWGPFWLRNIFVARLTERICSLYFSTDGSEYLAGLIHDIGWLFLATHFPDEFTRVICSAKPLAEAEREYLPFGHSEIAGAIAARSLVPIRAVNAILNHHGVMKSTNGSSLGSSKIEPATSPRFLSVVISMCDQIADSRQLDIFQQSEKEMTFERIKEGPELRWLNHFKKIGDLAALADEEMEKSKEIFNVFFMKQ